MISTTPLSEKTDGILRSIIDNHQVLMLQTELLKESMKHWVGKQETLDEISTIIDGIQKQVEESSKLIHSLRNIFSSNVDTIP